MKKQGGFDRNQIVLDECFDDLTDISVKNNHNYGWAGTIVVKRNGKEVPLTCNGCEGSLFDKKIAVNGGETGTVGGTYCIFNTICKLTLQGKKSNNNEI